ncbi:MAG: hypothetical protein HY744_33095 [Deltaproteobacteria bacterium]|nr:hypothetical protein [Deltaproteobacteria bacterium]
MIVDLEGNDAHGVDGAEPASFGAGHLGYGLLWDVAGDDTYRAEANSLASSCLGVGILNDEAGDDRYQSVYLAQASAQLGLALLRDGAGADRYETYRESQGAAGYRGAALLLDLDGDDRYEAKRSPVKFPAAQNPKYNSSMSQGCGRGVPNGAVPLHETYAGGVGMLADLGGADEYQGGVFAQGVGYWFGVGIFIEAEGQDQYDTVWYGQGAAAHFAAGLYLDRAGNDSYHCLQDQCVGNGRDYSVGFHIDELGDDVRVAGGGQSMGVGANGGSGFCWDQAGVDSYQSDYYDGIGQAYDDTGASADVMITLGFFADQGGQKDIYVNPLGESADDSLWVQVGQDDDGDEKHVLAVGSDL